jgi:hypothetical protein
MMSTLQLCWCGACVMFALACVSVLARARVCSRAHVCVCVCVCVCVYRGGGWGGGGGGGGGGVGGGVGGGGRTWESAGHARDSDRKPVWVVRSAMVFVHVQCPGFALAGRHVHAVLG